MSKIHMMLQGKGGVGKTFISSIMAQYKYAKGERPLCIDTDPVNGTFQGYKALNVSKLELMEADEINPRKFDMLVEMISGNEKEDVIIDNGASCFVPLSHYLISNDVATLLEGMGNEFVLHTVITGGQALKDTVKGFSAVAKQFPESVSIVVWLNSYWGPIEHGKEGFESFKVYKEVQKRVSAIVKIPEWKKETFGADLSEILEKKLTFDEALQDAGLTIMTRQRLKIIQRKLFELMDGAVVLG